MLYLNQPFIFPSPAKINLFLHVVGQNENGYHQLETVFQFLSLADKITITATRNEEITLENSLPNVPLKDNLIYKAARLLQQQTHCNLGAIISINKVIPMGGGLGGGSSNAATVLVALNKLWQLNIRTEELCQIGLTLGADVPIFIHGQAAFAQGIGEKFTDVQPSQPWYLITRPPCEISTQSVFQSSDLPRNTPPLPKPFTLQSNVYKSYKNDCETVVIKHYPEVANLLDELLEYAPSRMTGTGSCIFSEFDTESNAQKCQAKLPKQITSFVTQGLNRSPLLNVMAELNNHFK